MGFSSTHLIGFGGYTDSSFTPASIANMKAWYRSDLGITESGGAVSQWADQSGNGHHLAEATNKPTYSSTSGANSYPGLTFDGTNDVLAVTWSAVSQPVHVFSIIKPTSYTGAAGGHVSGGAIGERFSDTQNFGSGTGFTIYFGATGVSKATSDTTTHVLWEFYVNNASSSIIRANAAAVTGTAGTSTLSGFTLGRLPTSGFESGVHTEHVVYTAQVTGSNLTNLRSYFSTRYGVLTN